MELLFIFLSQLVLVDLGVVTARPQGVLLRVPAQVAHEVGVAGVGVSEEKFAMKE